MAGGNQARLIFKNTAALAASRATESAVSIMLSFFVARRLGASGLGIYSAAIVFFGLIAVASEMGSTNFLIREIAKDRHKTSSYLSHLGTMSFAAALLVIAAARLIVPHLGYTDELRTCVYIVMCATIPGTWRTIQEAVFVAHQRVEFVTYSTLCSALVNLVTVLVLLHKGYGIVSLVVAFAAVQYVVSICYFLFINSFLQRLRWQFNIATAKELLKGVRAFAGSSILAGLCARPEIVILSLFGNEAQIGFYSAALRLITVWAVIPQTFMTNVYPVLAQVEHEGDRIRSQRILDTSLKYLLACSLPIAVGLYVAASPVVSLLYGPGFEPSVVALKIMVWSIPLSFFSSLLWRLLAARGDQHLVLQSQMVTTVLRLVGGYLLIAAFSSRGAAIGSTVSVVALNLMLEFYVGRNGTRLRMFRMNWRLFACALLMGAGSAMLVDRIPLWLLIPLAACFYGAAVFLLKVWTPDDTALFRRALQSRRKGRDASADEISNTVSA